MKALGQKVVLYFLVVGVTVLLPCGGFRQRAGCFHFLHGNKVFTPLGGEWPRQDSNLTQLISGSAPTKSLLPLHYGTIVFWGFPVQHLLLYLIFILVSILWDCFLESFLNMFSGGIPTHMRGYPHQTLGLEHLPFRHGKIFLLPKESGSDRNRTCVSSPWGCAALFTTELQNHCFSGGLAV